MSEDNKTHYRAPRLNVDIFKTRLCSQLNGTLTIDGLHKILAAKDYHLLNIRFPSVSAFLARITG